MEKGIYKHMEKAMEQPCVQGVLLTDSDGLCIAATGNAKPETSGLISSLAKQAATTRPTAVEEGWTSPVVTIETDANKKIVIRSTPKATTALYKSMS